MSSPVEVGPGLYGVLGVLYNAPVEVIRSSYFAAVERVRESNFTYDEPTRESRASLEAQLDQLRHAKDVLTDLTLRTRYNRDLSAAALPSPATSPAPANANANASHSLRHQSRPSASSRARTDDNARQSGDDFAWTNLYPDSWVPERDGRFTSAGRWWEAPPGRSLFPRDYDPHFKPRASPRYDPYTPRR